MNARLLTAGLSLTLALGACGDAPTTPALRPPEDPSLQKQPGSGLVLHNLTDVTVPILGDLGDALIIDQVVLTNLTLVEDVVGGIVGLEATGTVTGFLDVVGGLVAVDEEFTSTVRITSSGPGQCDLITIDLGGLTIDALGLVTADVPEASLVGKGSGAVGSLLCNLGSLVGGLAGGGAGGLVNAINNQL